LRRRIHVVAWDGPNTERVGEAEEKAATQTVIEQEVNRPLWMKTLSPD
jgi:hypothetical protein